MWPSAIIALLACQSHERAEQTLTEEVYLWQRVRGADVQVALETQVDGFDAVMALAAEVQGGEVTRVPLPQVPRLGLVLRIGPGALPPLQPLADELLARAAREAPGAEITELQIDYDAASGALPTYARALSALEIPVPLSCTALPDWIGRPGFDALPCERMVLQVHSLELGRGVAEATVLDPERALAWVAAVERPVRVALPTHGFRLSGAGEVRADPADVAGLVRAWSTDRPPTLLGLAWFRLPVPGDDMAWAAPTLAAVRRGESPAGRAEIQVQADGPLVQIAIHNAGDADLAPPDVDLRWGSPEDASGADPASLLAADGLGGARVVPLGDASLRLDAPEAPLRPGQTRALGWLRLSEPAPVAASLAATEDPDVALSPAAAPIR